MTPPPPQVNPSGMGAAAPDPWAFYCPHCGCGFRQKRDGRYHEKHCCRRPPAPRTPLSAADTAAAKGWGFGGAGS